MELRTRNSIVHRVWNEWRNTFKHFSFKSASTEWIGTRRHAGHRKGTKADTKETILMGWHGLGFIKTNRGVELEKVSQPSCSEKTSSQLLNGWSQTLPCCSSEFWLANEEGRLPMCGGPSSWRAQSHSSLWQRGYPQLSTPDVSLQMIQKGRFLWTSAVLPSTQKSSTINKRSLCLFVPHSYRF